MSETENKDDSVRNPTNDDTIDDKVSVMSAEQNTENFIETYHAISEWIRFADAKAAVILTVGGAMASFLVPTIREVVLAPQGYEASAVHLIPNWEAVCVGIFGFYIVCFLLSGIWAFLCISPIQKRGKHPALGHCSHFHPAAVASSYADNEVERFVSDCNSMGAAALKSEVQAAILIDSHVSAKKYGRVKLSLFYFSASVMLGFLYFLVVQL